MPELIGPFAHHPELRNRIADSETSYFRTFSVEAVMAADPQQEVFRDWVHTDAQREAIRAEALADHSGDLWIFGYGSLMWDPALRFAEVRRAHVAGYARRLILVDTRGGRGTEEAPGLFATLDAVEGCEGCEGLAFRIAAAHVEAETEILFRREVLAPGYLARFVPAWIGDAEVRVLTFVADHDVPDVRPDLTYDEQVRYIAHGAGDLGTSRDHLANIVGHFTHLGITDAHCSDLLCAVDAHLASLKNKEPSE